MAPASAELTSPAGGEVVRGGAVTLTEDAGARALDHLGNPFPTLTTACGAASSNPAPGVVAHSLITVTAPNGSLVHTAISPPRYLGKFVGAIDIYDRGGPWTTQWAIPEDAAPGIYTVTSTAVDRKRNSSIGTACTNQPERHISTVQFEYRPFQHRFRDVLGNGGVGFNLTPAEFQVTAGVQSGEIRPGGSDMTFYALADPGTLALPSDPNGCAADPASCVPASATACNPSAGCVPRLVVINHQSAQETLVGVFDLESKAFIAAATVRGSHRLLLSLGTEGDAQHRELLGQLSTSAAAQGIDLLTLLGTEAQVRVAGDAGTTDVRLSLLNGLQIDPGAAGGASGVQISSDFTAQIGLVLHTYAFQGAANPTGQAGLQLATSPRRFTPRSGAGYTVQQSDLVPKAPSVVPVIAPGGPLYHVTAKGGAGEHTNALAVDTAAGAPSGLPVWLPVADPAHAGADRSMDFVGHLGLFIASEACAATTCSGSGLMLGLGAALFNNPLPVGLGDIPIWDPQSPEVVALMDQISQAIDDASATVVEDPAVQDLLGQVMGLVALPV